jgi:membrane-bound toxin of toxin-antitoxin system
MSQTPSLRLDLKPSPVLAGALAAIHVLALAAVAAALAGWPLLLVCAGIALSLMATVAHALQRTGAGARALELRADGRAAWRDRAGRWREATVLAQRFVSPALVILALEDEALGRQWVVVPPDAADGESLRRLRAWLRWRADASDSITEA